MRTKTRNQNLPIIYDNIFDHIEQHIYDTKNGSSIIVPHVCNNINVFGGGFTAGIVKHYPIVRENYHLLGNKNILGYVQFIEVLRNTQTKNRLVFANMIAQNGVISYNNPRPLNYYALSVCMKNVADYIDKSFDADNKVQIHAPKFGSDLAGGNWLFIQELIKDIWSRYSVLIYSIKK